MVEIISFDSNEEMLAHLTACRDAGTPVAPAQAAITYGDHWIQYTPIFGHTVVVFGRVLPHKEIRSEEVRLGATQAEAEATTGHYVDRHNRGLVFGMAYSTLEVDGELGTTHKASAWPISPELFRAARQVGWQVGDIDDVGLILEAALARMHLKDVRG